MITISCGLLYTINITYMICIYNQHKDAFLKKHNAKLKQGQGETTEAEARFRPPKRSRGGAHPREAPQAGQGKEGEAEGNAGAGGSQDFRLAPEKDAGSFGPEGG